MGPFSQASAPKYSLGEAAAAQIGQSLTRADAQPLCTQERGLAFVTASPPHFPSPLRFVRDSRVLASDLEGSGRLSELLLHVYPALLPGTCRGREAVLQVKRGLSGPCWDCNRSPDWSFPPCLCEEEGRSYHPVKTGEAPRLGAGAAAPPPYKKWAGHPEPFPCTGGG